jgi:DNA-directed RNA polymerase subunit RPC12/RpoP
MSPLSRYRIALSLGASGLAAFMVVRAIWGTSLLPIVFWGIIALTAAGTVWSFSIRCPACGLGLLRSSRQRAARLTTDVEAMNKCIRCGHDLRQDAI